MNPYAVLLQFVVVPQVYEELVAQQTLYSSERFESHIFVHLYYFVNASENHEHVDVSQVDFQLPSDVFVVPCDSREVDFVAADHFRVMLCGRFQTAQCAELRAQWQRVLLYHFIVFWSFWFFLEFTKGS